MGPTRRDCIALYKEGHSCAKIAAILGVNAGTVWAHLRLSGVKMRKGRPRLASLFGGHAYYMRKDGYFVRHVNKGGSIYLHRAVWEAHYKKKIPKGYHIHHIDGNKANNTPRNLACLSNHEHIVLHRRRK